MTRINLLPPEEQSKAAREQGLLLAVVGLIVLVLALGALYFMSYRQVADKQAQINSIAAQVDQANSQLAALKPYEAMQVQRKAMQDTAQQIYNSRVLWSNIVEEIGLLIPEKVSLQNITATVPPYMQAGGSSTGVSSGSAAAATSTGLGTDLTLRGDATGATVYEAHNQVADFMTRLGLMPQILNIQLVSSAVLMSSQSAQPDVQFTITATLRPFAVSPPLAPPAPAIVMGGAQ
jgi:Tfp pilus assembly protein PilN